MYSIPKLVAISCLILLISCSGYESLEIQNKIEKQADSLFKSSVVSLKKVGDSLCDLNYDHYYNNAIDSIRGKQIDDIKIILDK